MRGNWGFRGAALLAVGALSLHELRYWLFEGTFAMSGHGHSYMPLAVGLVTVLLLLACASFSRTLVLAARGIEDTGHPPPVRVLWPLLSAALLAVFFLQEWIEGWTTPGHPMGIGHVVGHIGIAGIGLAVAIGAVIALLLRGADSTARALARRRHTPRRRPRAALTAPPLEAFFVPRIRVLADNLAGRAPPPVS
jgi:hypothetical protein